MTGSPVRRIIVSTVVASVLLSFSFAAYATHDEDDDPFPEAVEHELCKRELIVLLLESTTLVTCEEGRDLDPTMDVPGPDDLTTDGDGDSLPDYLESFICAVESDADPNDGTCNAEGDDYTAPDGVDPGADPVQSLHEVLCGVEDPTDPVDGDCADPDGDGNETYSPPPAPAIPGAEILHNAICDNVEDPADPADGDCADPDGDGNQTYTPPPPPAPPALPGSLDEAMCGNDAGWQALEDPATPNDGTCSEDGDYSLPGGVDPGGVLAGLHCSESTDLVTLVESIKSDYDCDSDGNIPELLAGCDPTDPASNPSTPGTCDGPSDLPPEPPESPICSDEEPGVGLVEDILSDADCDGDGNLNDDDPLTPG